MDHRNAINLRLLLKASATVRAMLILLICVLTSCASPESDRNDPQRNLELVGCWKGGLTQNGELIERDLELRLLSLRPDSTLALTAIYELGPRSRVWEYDTEIAYHADTISWLAHRGYLSDNGDTMYVTKSWKGEESQWMFIRDRSSDQFLTKLISSKSTIYDYQTPAELNDGWDCTDLGSVGFDETRITQLVRQIKDGKHGDIHSLLIGRSGKLTLEEYFALNGAISGSYVTGVFRDKVHQMSSTTKGVVSVICGIAIDDGFIPDVDEPIHRYLPEYANSFTEASKQISVKDMLTMQAGWEWDQFKYKWSDPRNNAAQMLKCEDVIKYVVERPLDAEPGKKFKYSNGVPTVLGRALGNAIGMELDEYAEQALFEPLGISAYWWTRYPDGSLETDGGLALRSRDMAKIGQLLLDNGDWKGNRIVSENWIWESTQGRVSFNRNHSYGYYWMEMKLNDEGVGERAVFIAGDGGQFIVVFPAIDMLIVITAGNYGLDPTATYWKLIRNEIFPALKSENMRE